MPVPLTVRHQEVMTALQPLFDLLGVTAEVIYADPPLAIGVGERDDLGRITFTAAVNASDASRGGVVDLGHPQGPDANAELRHFVSVRIV